MSERESEVNPFLRGNFAPWREEGRHRRPAGDRRDPARPERHLLPRRARTRPSSPTGRYHWFDGDGMVHAIKIEDGRASYRNRWVESDGLKEERKAGQRALPRHHQHVGHRGADDQGDRQHQHRLARREAAGARRVVAPDRDGALHARDRRPLRLRRQAHGRHDRASQDGSRDRRDAVLRLRALPAVPHVPRRRPQRRRSRAPR